jgi:hypothetical protein
MKSSHCVAIGPELTEFGSWNWIGKGLLESLSPYVQTRIFSDACQPQFSDVIVFVKFKPPLSVLQLLRRNGSRLVFIPIDIYGSAAEIDADRESLKLFDLVLLHSHRLLRYFDAAPRVAFLDHPLKYTLSVPRLHPVEGPLLWIGRRCNLSPIVNWFNQNAVNDDLWILTNFDGEDFSREHLGFLRPRGIRLGEWNEPIHLEWLAQAGTAVDIKGHDFRSRHKPPAKAFDYLASGIPVLTNLGSSTALEMTYRGLEPLTTALWRVNDRQITADYIQHCTNTVRQVATPECVWSFCRNLLQELIQPESSLSGTD